MRASVPVGQKTLLGTQLRVIDSAHEVFLSVDDGYYEKQYTNSDELLRELQALQECQSPHIQRVISVDMEQRKLVLEYDYDAIVLNQFQVADRAKFLALVPKIVTAIKHCHLNGWVHGDIKPSNILYLSKNETIRLVDFGASYRTGTLREALSQWQVTPMFASSERMSGEGRVKVEDDWFSLKKMLNQVAQNKYDASYFEAIRTINEI